MVEKGLHVPWTEHQKQSPNQPMTGVCEFCKDLQVPGFAGYKYAIVQNGCEL